ncbi:hypothetical protein [Nonomuraea dietziae]|uniref:hypothetical protein n=1 Tax=Nonomuraea dietziae TaxID=65515 RepID=UPI003CD06E99
MSFGCGTGAEQAPQRGVGSVGGDDGAGGQLAVHDDPAVLGGQGADAVAAHHHAASAGRLHQAGVEHHAGHDVVGAGDPGRHPYSAGGDDRQALRRPVVGDEVGQAKQAELVPAVGGDAVAAGLVAGEVVAVQQQHGGAGTQLLGAEGGGPRPRGPPPTTSTSQTSVTQRSFHRRAWPKPARAW